MIITLTMNPAVDRTLQVDKFTVDRVNLIREDRADVGGKGINVSKVIRQLGGRTKTITFLGGPTGTFIGQELDKMKIGKVAVPVNGITRTNLKIVDLQLGTYTDLNEPGPVIGQEELELFVKQLRIEMTAQSLVVLTGSVPQGVPASIYRDLILDIQKIGARAALDADHDVLKLGIEAAPFLVKPNIHELERLVGRTLEGVSDIMTAARELISQGIRIVIVTLGDQGALFVTEDSAIHAKGVPVQVLSTVGAGDALMGAFCYGLDKQLPLEETIRLSVGASAAMISTAGTQVPEFNRIYELVNLVELEKL